MARRDRRADTSRPATLEFRQAMKDFKTMFPSLDAELIECVLRSNSGHVDSTVDQLLQLSKSTNGRNSSSRRRYNGRRSAIDDDSTDSEDSFHSEFLDVPTSSDDDFSSREPPPMYTPRASDNTAFFSAATYPIELSPTSTQKKKSDRDVAKPLPSFSKHEMKKYRAWNPPMLGALPEDFLRILPQQYMSNSTKEKSKTQKSSQHQRHQFVSKPVLRNLVATTDPSAIPQALGMIGPVNSSVPPPGLTGPVIDDSFGDNTNRNNENLTPPPRPPRTMPVHHSRRRTPHNPGDRSAGYRGEHLEQTGMCQPSEISSHHHHPSLDSSGNSHRSRHHHHHRSSRQNQYNRSHSSQPQSSHRCSNNCNHSRRSSDFTSRRMVMVSRLSEPAMPSPHNDMVNGIDGFHSPMNDSRSHGPSATRGSSNHMTPHSHHSPSSQRNELQWYPAQARSSHRPSSTNSSRIRPRTSVEEEQYVEDCRLAILLQNEEFIRELKRNDDFLKELEKDRPTASPATEGEKDVVPMPDPDAKYTHGSLSGNAVKKEGDDTEKDDKAFKENLKHMGKSARKKFNEVAKKFSVRKKSVYKSMKNVDPVFANCEDDFELQRSGSPTFDVKD